MSLKLKIMPGAIQRLLAEQGGPSALETAATTFMEVQRTNGPGSGPPTPTDLEEVCHASQEYWSTPPWNGACWRSS